MIDLSRFCGVDDRRVWMRVPFSLGGFTYVSNGAVMIRVALDPAAPVADVPNLDVYCDRYFMGIEAISFAAPEATSIPSETEETSEAECDDCEGRGHEHECPNCTCKCDRCGGKGVQTHVGMISTRFCGALFRLKYIQQLHALPGFEVDADARPDAGKGLPLKFRFDGGYGVVAALNARYARHIEASKSEAA